MRFHVPGAVPSCCTRWQTVSSVSPSLSLEKSLRGWVAIVILILNQERHVKRLSQDVLPPWSVPSGSLTFNFNSSLRG